MPNITRYPQGLLDLLGLQSQGENPRLLSDTVVPVIDVRDQYAIGVQEPVTIIIAAPANGNNAGQGITVPVGEVWRLQFFGVFMNCGAAASAEITPGLNIDGKSLALGNHVVVGNNQARSVISLATPMFLRSGNELSITIQSLVGVPTVTTCGGVISRFRV